MVVFLFINDGIEHSKNLSSLDINIIIIENKTCGGAYALTQYVA
jgi:hypothetical protein